MFKYNTAWALMLTTIVMVSQAEATHFRPAQRRTPNRFLARQEAAPTDAAVGAPSDNSEPVPYPAAGVTPAIPFDLPTETEATLPDEVYGPPEAESTPDATYGPPAEMTTQSAPAAESDLVSQNLVQQRRQQAALVKRRGLVRSQPLLLQAVPAAGASEVLELVRAEPGAIYILK
ncbi:uncharacterized protein [Eurosta solidaginis]|uniref:uncharacterized protein n=1 Tax=Eurosta solidaginis TaxID=178769 RepID=UPI0035306BF4